MTLMQCLVFWCSGGQAAVQPPPARLPQHRLPRQRAQQQHQYPDAKLEAILHARRLADQAVDAFGAMEKVCRRPPTVAVHESTQYDPVCPCTVLCTKYKALCTVC